MVFMLFSCWEGINIVSGKMCQYSKSLWESYHVVPKFYNTVGNVCFQVVLTICIAQCTLVLFNPSLPSCYVREFSSVFCEATWQLLCAASVGDWMLLYGFAWHLSTWSSQSHLNATRHRHRDTRCSNSGWERIQASCFFAWWNPPIVISFCRSHISIILLGIVW